MLIIAGHILAGPGARESFLEAVQPMVSATLNERGCREYCFTADPNSDDRIMLYELWDDEASLAGHFASDHMAEWMRARTTLDVTSSDIKKYTISDVSSLG